MKNIFSLQDKKALITGGRSFIEAGAQVIITGRRESVLHDACGQLGENASYRACDLSQKEKLPALVADIENGGVALDILINNAGINMKSPALEVTDEHFEKIMQTNLNGLFALSREVARCMTVRRRGAILNITSMAALYGIPKVAAYTASKTALIGLTRALAVEFAPSGIRVNAIAPGFIFSDMTAKALDSDPDRKRRVMERTPMGRMGNPEEIAAAALFLCSDAASYVTGVNLPVDGGNSIGF
jgi:NAD(P)-dependent dehydrogenase (short-subunit alcohol dehydrogenase family)